MPLDISSIREKFPALSIKDQGRARVYLDNPAGTQVPQQVIERMKQYMIRSNANHGGCFVSSVKSDAILAEAHQAMGDFLNAPSGEEIIFGPNMTTLTFALSRSLAHWFKPGEQLILSRMDHDANVAPWLYVAKEVGMEVKWLPFNKESYRFELTDLEKLLSGRVRLVAVNYASNALGTVNDIKTITEMAHAAGALIYVDAVHYVPHRPTDVQAIGCDFLACSVYKFFGSHQGVLWGKGELLDRLSAYKVRPADDHPPGKFETGTQSHEAQAGALGALEYLAEVGRTMAGEFLPLFAGAGERNKYLHAAMAAIRAYEKTLSERLISGLKNIPGVTIHGISDPAALDERVPTVAFTLQGYSPLQIAQKMARENIFVWHGDYYALEVVRHLGLAERGGMVRVGAVHYNTVEEIDRFLTVLREM